MAHPFDFTRKLTDTLLGTFGAEATIKKFSKGTYSMSAGTETGAGTQTETVNCSPPAEYAEKMVDHTTIIAGDMKMLISAEGLTLIPDMQKNVVWTVLFDGIEYKLLKATTIHSGGQVAAYSLHLRR